MSESKANQCEFHLIKAWMPVSKPYLKASVKSITMVNLQSVRHDLQALSISNYCDNQYLINVYDALHIEDSVLLYDANRDKFGCTKDFSNFPTLNIMVKDDLRMYVYDGKPAYIIRKNDVIGIVNITGRARDMFDLNYRYKGRWSQQFDDRVYVIDHIDILCCVEWSDIEASVFDSVSEIDIGVEAFCVAKAGIAVLYIDKSLRLPGYGKLVNLNSAFKVKEWTIVERAASQWIIAGTNKNLATLVSISRSGTFRSKLRIPMAKIVYRQTPLSPYGLMIKTAASSRHSAALIVSEESGYCHLVSLDRIGRLTLLQTISPTAGLPVDMTLYVNTTMSISKSIVDDDLLVCCHSHVKKLTVELK